MKYKTDISIHGKTDMGRIRTNNEDAFVAQTLWDKDTYLAIAIDGVGGYEGGEIAADMAKRTIPEYLMASPNGERVELLKQAVTAANNAIFEAREADPDHGQMSCVLTASIIDVAQRQISMAHVGDSRLYSFHHGELKKLSHDHSLIGYREEIGDLTEEEAMHHPQRNVIGRDVGSQKHKVNDDDFIEAQVFPLLPNTTLLFCSDGLTDMITSSTIISILSKKTSLEKKVERLINAALEAGGKDNVTVVLFEYQSDEPEASTESTLIENSKEEKPMVKEDNKNGSFPQLPIKTSKSDWMKTVIPFVAGLLIGFGIAYICLSIKTKENEAAFEAKEQNYLDTISSLNSRLEQLQVIDLESIDSITTEKLELIKQLEEEKQQLNEKVQIEKKEKEDLISRIDRIKAEINALNDDL